MYLPVPTENRTEGEPVYEVEHLGQLLPEQVEDYY